MLYVNNQLKKLAIETVNKLHYTNCECVYAFVSKMLLYIWRPGLIRRSP